MRHPAWLGLVLVICSGSVQAGTLYFSADSIFNGLFRLDVTTGATSMLGETGVTGETVGLTASDSAGVLWGSTPFGINAIRADGSGSASVGGAAAEALVYDADGGTLYGGIDGEFFEISISDFTTLVPLADPGNDIEGLAYAGDGTIYGLSGVLGTPGVLYSYDIAGDAWSEVGFTGSSSFLLDSRTTASVSCSTPRASRTRCSTASIPRRLRPPSSVIPACSSAAA